MYLSNLIIKNYRSIKEIKLNFKKGKNIIVGKNNAGKSNIIKALDLVLGESSPTYSKSDNIGVDDFYTNISGISENELIIICVLKHEETDNIDFSGLNASGFYKKSIKDKISPPKSFEEFFNIGSLSSNIDGFLEKAFFEVKYERGMDYIRNENTTFNTYLKNKDFVFILKVTKNGDNKIIKEMKMVFGSLENINTLEVSSYEIGRNELLQSAILPSFRSPAEQLRLSSYSWYGKLMKKLVEKVDAGNEIQDKFEEIGRICNEKFSEIQGKIKGSCLEVAFPGADLSFQFGYNKVHDVYKNAKLFINDGVETKLEDKGSGIQSAIIIGLFQYYTTEFNTQNGALLCIEEPELFLHPHGRRSISNRLDDFLGSQDTHNQLILTTHSTEFINTTSSKINIIRLEKQDDTGTQGKSIDVNCLKNYLVDGNYNEIFFADKVIFCEGKDKYLIELVYKKELNDNNISVIEVGGKENFRKFIDIANKIGIQAYIVADFDFLLRDENSTISNYIYRQDITKLGDKYLKKRFGDDFDTINAKINNIRERIKTSSESFFYSGKNIDGLVFDEYYDDLVSLLKDLNNKGIIILNGEIEDLIVDRTLLTAGKLTLSSIFSINEKLYEGKTLEEIIRIGGLVSIKNNIIGNT